MYQALAEADEDDGADFAAAVRHVLSRESEWVEWKNQGCPAFERPPAPPFRPTLPAGADAGPPAKRRRVAPKGQAAATAALLRQVAVPADQLAGLRAAERSTDKDKPLLPGFEVHA